jgi:hypothetical protein
MAAFATACNPEPSGLFFKLTHYPELRADWGSSAD